MKAVILGLFLTVIGLQSSNAQSNANASATRITPEQQEIIGLSKDKWQWMADKKADILAEFFHDQSVFVHMGGSWGKQRELEVIRSGSIWYKQAKVYSASVNIIGNTAILLNDIDILAIVGGNEVVNPFMVTEVYVNEDGQWKMGSLSFSRLARPVKSE